MCVKVRGHACVLKLSIMSILPTHTYNWVSSAVVLKHEIDRFCADRTEDAP
jgi:hypothetical protein